MRKIALGIVVVLVIAFAGYNIHESQSKKDLLIAVSYTHLTLPTNSLV